MAGDFGPLVVPWDRQMAQELGDALAVWVAQNTTVDQDWDELAKLPVDTVDGLISVAELCGRIYGAGVRDAGMHIANQARLRGTRE